MFAMPSIVQAASAGALQEGLSSLQGETRDVFLRDHVTSQWIGPPGWRTQVEGVLSQVAERTCDLQLSEVGTGTAIRARRVLDGCRLTSGQALILTGQVRVAQDDILEVSAVRYLLP